MSRSMPEALAMPDAVVRPVRRRWFGAAPLHTVFLQDGGLWHLAPGAAGAVQHDSWAAWCARHAGVAVQVLLGGALTHHLLVPPALPLRQAREVEAWARLQWQHYHGPAAQGWAVSAWTVGGRSGACALIGVSRDTLAEAAQAHRVSLRSLRPWWCQAWPAVRAVQRGDSGVLWLVEGRSVLRLQVQDGRLNELEQRWLDDALPEALDTLIDDYDPLPGTPQWAVGYGLSGAAGLQRAEGLGPLTGGAPEPRWWVA